MKALLITLCSVVVALAIYITFATKSLPESSITGRTVTTMTAQADDTPPEHADELNKNHSHSFTDHELNEMKADVGRRAVQLSKGYTPEIQKRIVDSKMRQRSPVYQRLFDSWELAPETRQQLLEIIRQREAKLWSRKNDYLATGMTNFADLDNDRLAVHVEADSKLVRLLGDERLNALKQEEEKMNLDTQKKGAEIMRDRKARE